MTTTESYGLIALAAIAVASTAALGLIIWTRT
jgi:hypothetical protein